MTTERLNIREITEKDVRTLYQIYDDDTMRYVEPLYESYDEEVEFTRAYIKNMYGFYGYGVWILEKKDGTVIGRAGISNREYCEENIFEIGYLVGREYQCQGYATEAVRAIIQYAWDELEIEEIYCFIKKENIQSVNFAVKLGFVHDGNAESEGNAFEVYKISKEN